MATMIERFWARVNKTDTCWNWTGPRTGKKTNSSGYGTVCYGSRYEYAHRMSYELHYGPIPKGYVILHTCDNPLCVRPEHLRAGTQGQNVRDAVSKGRWMTPAREAWLKSARANKPLAEYNRKRALEAQSRPLPVGRKYGEIGIPEPGDGVAMHKFIILCELGDANV